MRMQSGGLLLAFLIVLVSSQDMNADFLAQSSWGGDCQTGKKQSPINIKTLTALHCPPHFSFELTSNNQNYTQIVYDNDNNFLLTPFDSISKITFSKNGQQKNYLSNAFHFHHKSMHHIDGKEFDIQVHLVHYLQPQQLAVFGMLFKAEEGEFSDPFDNWHLNTTKPIEQPFPINLTTPQRVLHYSGSQTTPPCTENIEWFINPDIIKIKFSTLQMLSKLINHGKLNDRDIQKLNGRKIIETGTMCSSPHKGKAPHSQLGPHSRHQIFRHH